MIESMSVRRVRGINFDSEDDATVIKKRTMMTRSHTLSE
jgi:hypothetical protein